MAHGAGGCLCGRVRFEMAQAPSWVTVCHCRFCQKATGSAYMVEPVFERDDLKILSGEPAVYDHVSAGSGKLVHVHFCKDCGTKLWLSFERFPDSIGVYAGTFDDPDWIRIRPEAAKHIFLGMARQDTIIPAGLPTYVEHAMANDGTPQMAIVYSEPHPIG